MQAHRVQPLNKSCCRYIDYLHGVIEQDSKQLAAARPTPAAIEAAAKAAAAASSATSSAKKAHGKSPKGPALPKRASSSSMAAAAAPLSPAVANMAAVRATFSGDHLQIAHSAALRHLCQGMMHMLVALSAAGVLSPPELPFNSMEERYDQRFGSLHILTRPEPLAYSVYKAAVDLKGAAPQGVLAAAATALAQVRSARFSESVMGLLGVHGMARAGWDPWLTLTHRYQGDV